jgi:hypothetical protein
MLFKVLTGLRIFMDNWLEFGDDFGVELAGKQYPNRDV